MDERDFLEGKTIDQAKLIHRLRKERSDAAENFHVTNLAYIEADKALQAARLRIRQLEALFKM